MTHEGFDFASISRGEVEFAIAKGMKEVVKIIIEQPEFDINTRCDSKLSVRLSFAKSNQYCSIVQMNLNLNNKILMLCTVLRS